MRNDRRLFVNQRRLDIFITEYDATLLQAASTLGAQKLCDRIRLYVNLCHFTTYFTILCSDALKMR